MLYIGVDLGTSAVKLLLMDGKGNIQKIVSKEYPIYFPHPGWSEQSPEDWFDGTMEGIKELLADCDKSEVAGAGGSGGCRVWRGRPCLLTMGFHRLGGRGLIH